MIRIRGGRITDLIGTGGASSYVASRCGGCGGNFSFRCRVFRLASPTAKQEGCPASSSGKPAGRSSGCAGDSSRKLAGDSPRICYFVPHDDLPRRGRKTVTPPNEPFCVLSASSARNTL